MCYHANMVEQLVIGPHRVDLEYDILVVHWVGSPELAPLIQVYERIELLIAERGYALVLFDSRHADLPSRETRRWVGQWAQKLQPGTLALASYGMNAVVRTMLTLVFRAIAMVQGPKATPTKLCSDETQARSWLADQRIQLTRTRPAHGSSSN